MRNTKYSIFTILSWSKIFLDIVLTYNLWYTKVRYYLHLHKLPRKYYSCLLARVLRQGDRQGTFFGNSSVFPSSKCFMYCEVAAIWFSQRFCQNSPGSHESSFSSVLFSSCCGGRHGRDRQAAKGSEVKLKPHNRSALVELWMVGPPSLCSSRWVWDPAGLSGRDPVEVTVFCSETGGEAEGKLKFVCCKAWVGWWEGWRAGSWGDVLRGFDSIGKRRRT